MVTQPQQRGVLPQQLDDLHLHLAAHDVPLVVEAQLGEHGVVLQSPHDGQDALARDEVGLDVDAGDVAVDSQHFRNGGGHAVVGACVGQTEGLHHRVGLEGLRETDEGLRRDVLDIVQIDFRGVRVVVFHLFQSILDHRRVSTGVDGSRGLCVPSAVAVGQMYVFNLAFKCLWPRVVRIDTTVMYRSIHPFLIFNCSFLSFAVLFLLILVLVLILGLLFRIHLFRNLTVTFSKDKLFLTLLFVFFCNLKSMVSSLSLSFLSTFLKFTKVTHGFAIHTWIKSSCCPSKAHTM